MEGKMEEEKKSKARLTTCYAITVQQTSLLQEYVCEFSTT